MDTEHSQVPVQENLKKILDYDDLYDTDEDISNKSNKPEKRPYASNEDLAEIPRLPPLGWSSVLSLISEKLISLTLSRKRMVWRSTY